MKTSVDALKTILLGVALALLAVGCGSGKAGEVDDEARVSVELYLMSQCPYGVKVMDTFHEVVQKMGSHIT